jgi:hypothetical protein
MSLQMTCVPVTHIRSTQERKHLGPVGEREQRDPANKREWLSEKEVVKYTPLLEGALGQEPAPARGQACSQEEASS